MTTTTIRDTSFRALKTVQISKPERYGYAALRIRRDALIESLEAAAHKCDIPINYEHKLVAIDEHDSGATCHFSNGVTKSASLVVGADGLHSMVRTIRFPNAPAPTYTGQAGIMWSVPRLELKYPVTSKPQSDMNLESTSMTTPQGVVLFVPNSSDGADMRIGAQRPLIERDVAGWKKLGQDKEGLAKVLRETCEEIPEPVRSAIEYAERSDKNEFFLWPFYVLSMIDGWVSKGRKGRVVLIGDGAHAFPPTGGQGAGMAVEDAHGLGLVLGMQSGPTVEERLKIWLKWRMNRIDRVAEYIANLGKSRLASPQPKVGDEGIRKETKPANPLGDIDDMAWLYDWESKEQLAAWMGKTKET